MAVSNRDRVGKMFDALSPALDAFISRVLAPELADQDEKIREDWSVLVALKDAKRGAPSDKQYARTDPYVQLRMLSENITGQVRTGWFPFDEHIGRPQQALASELREIRHGWAHGEPFTDDDAYRALDTAERLLTAIGAPESADEVRVLRLDLRRVTASKDDQRTLKASANANPESTGLLPWREVLQPHHDVATGNFHASEFAADLYKVSTGASDQSRDYAEPSEFYSRTYLTAGLRELLERTVRRLSGDANATPVINLQTNFGGGKTHSMLALWHAAAGQPLTAFPQEAQELLAGAGYDAEHFQQVRRVAIVGNHFSASGRIADDGTQINTIWGELAWQLGGAEAFALVAQADQDRTPPGEGLHTLLARYSPALILIDEWVAYARSLVPRDDLPAGTFDDQFTFAQSLTEVAKATPGVLLAVSIPASDIADGHSDEDAKATVANTAEVGGEHGYEALRRLQNVVRRVADPWRPASSDEAYEIVRRRLFTTPDAEALAKIGQAAREFRAMYERDHEQFPAEARGVDYEERIKRTYPIHPELFDRLYEDWSSLERFQRTRGVLRLMNTVIHALWVGQDASPLIMPGSVPLATAAVNSELTQYLQDNWKAVIDADVDGDNAQPTKIDTEKPLFGKRSLTKRLARTVFFASAPRYGGAQRGIDATRVNLGTAVPGDTLGNFRAALDQLGDRATYFYSAQGKYWYDLQANITRTAKDQADRVPQVDVWAEIVRRLQDQNATRGDFARVHVCPEDSADIPDDPDARLVILHPQHAHASKATNSPAQQFALSALSKRGTAQRERQNALVFLAADESRLAELERAVRDYLGWQYVCAHVSELDLTQNQIDSAGKRLRTEDETADSRLLQTFTHGLVPVQPDGGAPPRITVVKVDGRSTALAERVSRKLGTDGRLASQQAAERIRMTLDRAPAIWHVGHVSLGQLWELHTKHVWMPRLTGRDVLARGVTQMPLLWQQDAFALASGYDNASGRYAELWVPGAGLPEPQPTDALLLVQPERAATQLDADRAASEQASREAGAHPDLEGCDAPTPHGNCGGSAMTSGTTGSSAAAGGVSGRPGDANGAGPGDPPRPPRPTRFFGSKTLDPDRYAVDFQRLSENVLAHLAATDGAQLTVTIEIEAIAPDGFNDAKVRTVRENATTLKFEQTGFEAE